MTTRDQLSKPLTMLSSIIPPIGFFLFVKYRKQFPEKAKKALGAGLIGIPIGLIMGKYIMPFFTNLLF